MLVAPKFLSYERPEGYEAGAHPDVFVRRQFAELNGGVPELDYDRLAGLFQHELLGFPEDRMPSTLIYYNHTTRAPAGLEAIDHRSFRLGRALHINAYREAESFRGEADPAVVMERLIRRAAIYSLVRSDRLPKLSTAENWRAGAAAGAGGLALDLFMAGALNTAPVAGAMAIGLGLAMVDRRMVRLNRLVEPAVRELVIEHRDDIVFPNRPS